MNGLVSHHERWRFIYRGVEYEITKRFPRDKEKLPFWAYYIHIPESILPAAIRPHFLLVPERHGDKLVYRLSQCDFLNTELAWHGGAPDYYERVGGHDGMPLIFKIGCGYGQEWEKHIEYDRDNLEWQARQSIDSLTRLVLHGPTREY